jgi:hypothetical protein
MQLLKFSQGNAKLSNRLIFSLPAGHTCPNAGTCKTLANKITGKIDDSKSIFVSGSNDYRCFAAMAEIRPNVRTARWHNFNLIQSVLKNNSVSTVANLITMSMLPYKENLVRIHESGDFYSLLYMQCWIETARLNPNKTFYAFTKSLNYWLTLNDKLPDNIFITASMGGKLDSLVSQYPNIFKRAAYVVYTEKEAAALGLEIDHDDSHCLGNKPFALLVHGSQRAGSPASKAIQQRKKQNKFVGYNSKSKGKLQLV